MSDQPAQDTRPGSEETAEAPPPPPPVPPRPSDPVQVDRGGWRALWLGLGGLVLTLVFPPTGLICCVVALVIGIRAKRRARKDRNVAPGAVAGIIFGLIGVMLASMMTASLAIFWNELNTYQRCKEIANTISDEQACQDGLFRQVERKLNLREGSLKPYRPMF